MNNLKNMLLKNGPTLFLQVTTVLIGIIVFVLLLWEPQLEGVNAHASNFEIYFKDPFLALVYIGSIPFFIALYKAFRLLKHVRENKTFSQETVKALKTIKQCALTIIGFVVLEEVIIVLNKGSDDVTGGIAMGILIIFGSIIVTSVALMFKQIVQDELEVRPKID